MLSIPTESLVSGIREVLADIRHQQCLAEQSAERVYPLKRLRNNLINAMCLNIATQPVGAVHRFSEPKILREGGRPVKQVVIPNPVWKEAPRGAFLKSRRFCSLVTDICLGKVGSKQLLQLLKRLSINIWNVPKRHFFGLCRSIRAVIRSTPERVLYLKKSEALVRMRTRTKRPVLMYREFRDSTRLCRHYAECAAMRLSYKVGLVTESLRCTKCTVAVCTAKWFIHTRASFL